MKTLITHLNESINPLFRGTIKSSRYNAVDLGLSVKWCSCNVGATKPEDPGLLFQWGITDGYKYDDEKHGFLSNEDYANTYADTYGTKYKTGDILKLEDDAAYVNMKGNWRMPTNEEILELRTLPSEYTELNGVKGFEITGKNGNSIFMPAGGFYYCDASSFLNSGSECRLWASTVDSYNSHNAYHLNFHCGFCDFISHYTRSNAFSVRGVC